MRRNKKKDSAINLLSLLCTCIHTLLLFHSSFFTFLPYLHSFRVKIPSSQLFCLYLTLLRQPKLPITYSEVHKMWGRKHSNMKIKKWKMIKHLGKNKGKGKGLQPQKECCSTYTPNISNIQAWATGVAHFLQNIFKWRCHCVTRKPESNVCLTLTSLIYWLAATVLLRKGNWSQFSLGTKSICPWKNRRASFPAGTRGSSCWGQSKGQKPLPFTFPAGQQQLACRGPALSS